MVENLCCRPPSEGVPIGQVDLVLPDCARNTCEQCADGGARLLNIVNMLNEIGQGLTPTAKQWMKVKKTAQNGEEYEATEKKIKKYERIETFTADFVRMCTEYKLHYHQWIFQNTSEKLAVREVQDRKRCYVFHYYYDISENYGLKHLAAPQSTHWGSKSISIPTAVGFYSEPGQPVQKFELASC